MPRRTKALFAPPEGLVQTFGESRYRSGIGHPVELALAGTKRDIRGRLREKCPVGPGVYGFIDAYGNLTYVGMSRDLRKRLMTYFASRAGRKKEFRIGRKCTRLYWQPVAHTFLARLRESELIHRFRPQDNVEGQPSRTGLGYIVQTSGDAPCFEIKGSVSKRTRYMWGPMPIGRRTREAVEELNRAFLLRDCSPKTKTQFRGELPLLEGNEGNSCLRADLKTCLSPCLGACSREEYSQAVAAARQFLNGTDVTILDRLVQEMKQSVSDQRFERAARYRDIAAALERLNTLLRWFHDWLEQATFAYLLPAMHETFSQQAVVVVRGQIREIAPVNGRKQVTALLRTYAAPATDAPGAVSEMLASLPPEHFELARFLFRWFRRYPDERARLIRSRRSKRAA